MGGYNIGELFGALNLDDSQFSEALNRAGGASQLFKVQLNQLNTDILNTLAQFQQAGYDIKALVTQFSAGITPTRGLADVVKEFADSLGAVQARAQQLQNLKFGGATELENYRAMLVAEDLRLNKLREEYKVTQDYLSLVSRLKEEQEAGVRATLQGLEQERQYRAHAMAQASAAQQDYANLVSKLRTEEAAANEAAQAKIRAAVDAAATEKQKQYQLDLQAAERIASEEVALQEKANRDIAAAERARFIEHRRLMQESSAFTTVGVAVGGAGAAVVGGELFVGKQAADFQEAMAKSLAVIGTVSNALRNDLGAAAISASKQTGLAAKDIASDFAVMAKGGRTAGESVQQIGDFSKYARANQVDLHDATKQVLTVMESLRLESTDTTRVMDVLTRANQLNRESVDQLATSLEGKGGAALRRFGVTLEQAVAISTLYARAGIDGAKAQTIMSQLVQSFTTTVEKHGNVLLHVNGESIKWRDVVYDSTGKVRTFNEIVGALNNAFRGFSAESVSKALADLGLGGVRTANALQPLLGSNGTLSVLEKAMMDAGGATNTAFNAVMQGPLAQLDLMKAKLMALAITLGTPVIAAIEALVKSAGPLFDIVTSLVTKFSELPNWLQQCLTLTGLLGGGALIAGGSLLVMAGSVLRLAADLQLLNATGGLASSVKLLVGFGEAALIAAAAAAVLYGAYKVVSEVTDSKKSKPEKALGLMDYFFGNMPGMPGNILGPKLETIDTKDIGEKKASDFGLGITSGLDTVRKQIEDAVKGIRKTLEEANRGQITDTPVDPVKERARLFANLGVTDYVTSIKQLKKDLAEATASGIFTPDQISLAQEGIRKIEDEYEALAAKVATGSKIIATNQFGTNVLAEQFKEIKDQARQALDFAVKVALELKAGKIGRPEDVPIPQTLNDISNKSEEAAKWWEKLWANVARTNDELKKINNEGLKEGLVTPQGPDGVIQRIESFAKFHGINFISQHDLDTQASYAKQVFDELNAYKTNGGIVANQTLYSSEIAFIEAEARARHISAQDYAKSIGENYNALRQAVENTVTAGNEAWRRSLQQVGREFSSVINNVGGGLANLIPLFSQTQGPDSLTQSFRSAYEQLSAYSDPKKALTDLINSIKTAGSISQANALAVKYFGATAGPLLAAEIRNGTISVQQISAAINEASLSTAAYDAQTNKSVSAITQLWQKAVQDIVRIIAVQLIQLGLKNLIDWMFKVGTSSSKMADDVIAAIKKIGQWIGVIKPTTVGGIPSVPGGAGAGAGATTTAADDSAGPIVAALGANTAALAVDTASTDVDSAATTVDAGATIADSAVTVADTITTVLNTIATNGLTAAIGALVAASAKQAVVDVQSSVKYYQSEAANTAATQANSAATQSNTATGITPNTQATLANTQALLANTAALISNTTALGFNTTALGALTAAIIALIARLSTSAIGSIGNQLFGGGGGIGFGIGSGFPSWNPWDDISQWASIGLTGPAGGYPGGGGGGGGTPDSEEGAYGKRIHFSGPITVVANDPTSFVNQLKLKRMTSGR